MKVVIVIPSLTGGGAEFVAREWARWLSEKKHHVTVAVVKSVPSSLTGMGYDVVRLAGSNPFQHVAGFRRLIKKLEPDVVLGMLPYFNLLAILGCLGRKQRPRIAISGRNVEVPFPHVHGKNVVLTRLISKILYRKADAYLAISHPVAAEAGALYGIASERITVVPNPATAKVARSGRFVAPDVSHEFDDGVLNILVPARIAAQKRPRLVIDVAEALANEGIETRVHYFGDGPLRDEVERYAHERRVECVVHGWVEDWFHSAPGRGVVLLTSLVEGFGNVLLEAAATGIPSVVSSRCLGAADAVVPGITGQLASGDSVEDYVAAVRAARGMRLDSETVQSWVERFSIEGSGQSVETFLKRVVAL